MVMMRVLLCALLLINIAAANAQQDSSRFAGLNLQRIHTNETGMKVLGAWGAANIIEGVSGYLIAKDQQWRSFHQMNAIWGIVNLGIAGAGYMGARREAEAHYNCGDALHHYEATKRLFLINAGLDVLYITSGIIVTQHGKITTHGPEVWRGYGKSITLQGAGLLLFDVTMYSAHARRDKGWYKLLQGVCFTGNGVGLNYQF